MRTQIQIIFLRGKYDKIIEEVVLNSQDINLLLSGKTTSAMSPLTFHSDHIMKSKSNNKVTLIHFDDFKIQDSIILEFKKGSNSQEKPGPEKRKSWKTEAIAKKNSDDSQREIAVFSNFEGRKPVLKVSKLLLMTGLSVLDVVTDVLWGVKLINCEHLVHIGIAVLISCWVPGVVAVIHMIADYRKDYFDRVGEFLVTLFVLFIFYPLAPFILFVIRLIHFNEKSNRVEGKVEKILSLAVEIEGSIEAPVQLIITTFLIMRGFLKVPWESSQAEDSIDLGHGITIYFPLLPFLSMLTSALSILKASLTMNVFNIFLTDVKQGYLPFFCHSILFRVLSFTFFLVFFEKPSCLVFLIIFIGNLVIGYWIAPKIMIPKKLSKYFLRDSKHPTPPIWLNSLLSILVPSSYLSLLNLRAIEGTGEDKIRKSANKFTKTYQKTIMRRQILFSTVTILISVGIISALVNLTEHRHSIKNFIFLANIPKYRNSDNILNNTEFNVFCIVLGLLGIFGLIFMIDIDVLGILRIVNAKGENRLLSRKFKWLGLFIRSLVTLAATIFFLSPAIGGFVYNEISAPVETFVVFNKGEYGTASLEIKLIKTSSYSPPENKSLMNFNQWSHNLECNEANYMDFITCNRRKIFDFATNLVINMNSKGKECYQRLVQSQDETKNCLTFNAVILLEKEKLQNKQFEHSLRFPIISLNYTDWMSVGFESIINSQLSLTNNQNQKVNHCHVINNRRIFKYLGEKHSCFERSAEICENCIHLETCEIDIKKEIRFTCLDKGEPCRFYESFLEEKINLTHCDIDANESNNAIVISGGKGLRTVEAFHPIKDLNQCNIPEFPEDRFDFTMNGWTVCGGGNNDCMRLEERNGKWKWNTTNTLAPLRYAHTSWRILGAVVLIGGSLSPKTTAAVRSNLKAPQDGPFTLKYESRYLFEIELTLTT